MKRLLVIGGIAVMVAALALPALARGPGWEGGPGGNWGPGNGPRYGGWGNLTEEQSNQMAELSKKFYDNTAQLRNQIWTKRGELQTLMSSPSPDAEKAKALSKELSDLQGKMAQERLNYALEVRKINPDARFGMGYGRGWGRGMGYGGNGPGWGGGMGYGGMMGYGGHMGGGNGPGWGPGMGYGGMMGYGRHMGGGYGGYGPGACWN